MCHLLMKHIASHIHQMAGLKRDDVSLLESEKSNIFPKRYNSGKSCYIYYRENCISGYELIQTAVEVGAIT